MKICTRHTAAVALAVVLSLPTAAFAASQTRELDRSRGPFTKIIKKIQKLVGISTNSEIPSPPLPEPKP